MTLIGLPSPLPPKSSSAICAAVTDPCPVGVDAGPFMSVSTPILTTPSDTCASAGVDSNRVATTAGVKNVLTGICTSRLYGALAFFAAGAGLLPAFFFDYSWARVNSVRPADSRMQVRRNRLSFSGFIQYIAGMVTTQRLAASLTPLD